MLKYVQNYCIVAKMWMRINITVFITALQYKCDTNSKMTLIITTLSIMNHRIIALNAEYCYAECHLCAECRDFQLLCWVFVVPGVVALLKGVGASPPCNIAVVTL